MSAHLTTTHEENFIAWWRAGNFFDDYDAWLRIAAYCTGGYCALVRFNLPAALQYETLGGLAYQRALALVKPIVDF